MRPMRCLSLRAPPRRPFALRPRLRVACRVAVGIDLGTTNSAVAIVLPGAAPRVLSVEGNALTCPSVVHFAKDGVHVGHNARIQPGSDASNTFSSTKRLMGQKWQDVQDVAQLLPYGLSAGQHGDVQLECSLSDGPIAPEQVAAEVLRHLLQLAQQHTGEAVHQAVVTVPAYFTPPQREATIRAGNLAGLDHISLLQEPVAAALAHGFGMDPQAADTILVADLGGGTFDVSMLDGFEGILEVLATDGDARLGGDDFDRCLAQHLLAQLPSEASAAIRGDAELVGRVVQEAERGRVLLSSQEEAAIQLPVPGGGVAPSVAITRGELEGVVEPLLRRLWELLERLAAATHTEYVSRPWFARGDNGEAGSSSGSSRSSRIGGSSSTSAAESLSIAGANSTCDGNGNGKSSTSGGTPGGGVVRDKWAPPPRRVTGLVLVGGASQTPSVRRLLEEITGLRPRDGVDPSTGVALGAAVQAGVMTGLLEVGPELMDGSYLVSLHDRASGFQSQ